MSCQEEQDIAGVVIDSLKFAVAGGSVAGKLDLVKLPRLADVLTSQAGELTCSLSGFRIDTEQGERFGLHLTVAGRLGLCCQRCLAEVGFDCGIDSRLLLMPEDAQESEWPEEELESDEYDAIPADRSLSLRTLVEDEVLLALPLVPRHADCLPPGMLAAEIEENGPSPFAVLAGLKKH